MGNRPLCHQKRGGQVDGHCRLPDFQRTLFDPHPPHHGPGVVDQNIEPARSKNHLVNQFHCLFRILQIGGEHPAFTAPLTNPRQCFLSTVPALMTVQRHLGTGISQSFGDGPPDADTSTGDERGSSG